MTFRQMMISTSTVLLLSSACGNGSGNDENDSGDDGDSLDIGGSEGVTGSPDIDGCTDSYADTNGCVGETYEGESVPLDIYIMFDQSLSMDCIIEAEQPWQQDQCCGTACGIVPRIDPVREAVAQFLTDERSSGISVGMGFFGNLPVGSTSCDPDDYSDPAVEIDRLPDHADAVLDVLYDVAPTGETPTGAAIRGACNYVGAWHAQQPSHKKVILLVTDGIPEAPSSSCNPTIEDAASAAEECFSGSPAVPTYVLGVGQALGNLDDIAAAGGTEEAYLVDADVEQSVLAALNAIRADAVIPCTLSIPQPSGGGTIDYGHVNIGICDAGGGDLHTYFVEQESDCDNGAWYYEDTSDGRVIQLCDATCDTVSSAGATLFFSVGCETVMDPIR